MNRSIIFALLLAMMGASSALAAETVRYRLPEWKKKHIHDSAKAEKISKTLEKLGCEVEKAQHNGHIDLKYRCPEWKQLDLETHDEAHKWESWLKEFKFETEHKH